MKRTTSGMAVLAAMLTVGCAPHHLRASDGDLEREALAGVHNAVPAPLPIPASADANTSSESAAIKPGLREISHGSGRFIKPQALATPRPVVGGEGTVTLNFEDQPVEAVAKAILGDLLDVNYSIAPGVSGNISFSTARPVARDEALPILETLLSWTGNALVQEHDRYSILPASKAVAGKLVPRLKATKPAPGMGVRLFPLRHVAAPEMARLLAPFTPPEAVLLADPARNVLVIAGTRDELANVEETIDTFDVDWVGGMSVGVFSLENASVGELMPALDSVFGQKSGAPVAGLIRFIPIERTNAVVVIATRAEHLDQVGEWIGRIDRGGGNEARLFVYDVRHLLASDVARYVANVFGGSANGDQGGSVMPGLGTAPLGEGADASLAGASAGGTDTSSGFEQSEFFQPPTPAASGMGQADIRVTAIDANNQLMVRARPSQWSDIRKAIERLDAMPLQVQIETRILEVRLVDSFRFGVQWYLEGLIGGKGGVGQPGNQQQGALGSGGALLNATDTFYYSFVNKNLQVALRALETNGNTKTLAAPSLVVVNNKKARIQIGDQIPVTQTIINSGTGGEPLTQVEYKDTGVILDVRPRVNPGGLVYLEVSQEVSRVEGEAVGGNRPIAKRHLNTQVAVRSGQTVLLGGLIREFDSETVTAVPYLSRIPVLGALFRGRSTENRRTELLVMITPKVIASAEEAKRTSDEYRRSFRTLRPFEQATAPVLTAPSKDVVIEGAEAG